MGGYVDFKCRLCGYEETRVGVGRGRQAFPVLKLYTCDHCKSFASVWIHESKIPCCVHCYHDAIHVLDDDVQRIACPKCGETALVSRADGEWS